MKKIMQRNLLMVTSLALLSCLTLSACGAGRPSSSTLSTSGGNEVSATKTSNQDIPDAKANPLEDDDKCLPGGQSDIQIDYWEVEEFEDWMEQQRSQNQKLADSRDKSFFYKDDNGNYVSREWTQEDVDSLYKSWQDQLAMMKEGYHFTKSMSLTDGGMIAGAFDPETWNAKLTSAPDSTTISLPDGSTVDLGHFDTPDAATSAVKKYLEEQVSSGKMTQADADKLLNNGSIE